MGTAIVITSGKGGTGKTTCSAAIASALAVLGHRTICLDCDIGLKNLDLSLGLTDSAIWDFSDVLSGAVELDDAAGAHPEIENLFFLSAPSELEPADIDPAAFSELINKLKSEYDYIIIDSPAGLGTGFRLAAGNADIGIIVSTADASSLRDGQRTAAELRRLGVNELRLIVNRVEPRKLKSVKTSIDDIIDAIGARLLGLVSEDDSVQLASNLEKPLILFGARYAYDQFFKIARRITGDKVPLGRL
ncbi:MAG: septum site-determining protein MinD [Oscillospiraceae bacterium]